MKFEYTHEFEIDSLLKAQGELSQNLYSSRIRWLSIALLSFCAIITIVTPTIIFTLVAEFFLGQELKSIGTLIGLILGLCVYGKWGVSFIDDYVFNKRQVDLGEDFVSDYTFTESGIIVIETGRHTEIKWSAISSLEQTPSYIGLLCKGLFYYLPREVIGDTASQNQFISQCQLWMENAKTD